MKTSIKKWGSIFGIVIMVALGALVGIESVEALDLGQSLAQNTANEAGFGRATNTTLAETIGGIVKTALSFVGIIFTVLMVYAGYLWMTARGEDAQIDKAKKIVRSAIVGIVIAVGAYSITAFVIPIVFEETSGTGNNGGGAGLQPQLGEVVGCCQIRTFPFEDPQEYEDEYQVVHNENQCVAECGQQFFEGGAPECQFRWVEGISSCAAPQE
ncbi:MAG: hypothetical protein HN726_04240 [Candidatus Magasanikbacteria bacterium]|jgi:hypothetical protein|nr:hypothetical protein [Candidatus Magasanikbacteria bacterium]MBT4221494.1 hypothetical protein [Candidatus Magasanikbacteria bacterium]MBT4350327.1 hypothetical protein [Candidatus Magasanikbacteria bacterium]MBT4541898.1 hypothetical protein [Candidatus Magasanikbacteria bacterium]MBT6252814.1 hypothetical protein [Candidatus Magasanikbacteria bacterium]